MLHTRRAFDLQSEIRPIGMWFPNLEANTLFLVRFDCRQLEWFVSCVILMSNLFCDGFFVVTAVIVLSRKMRKMRMKCSIELLSG